MESAPEKPAGVDLKTALETLIGDSGIVVSEYGGFLITVVDHVRFPWFDVLCFLLGESFEIWVDKRDDKLVVGSKQRLD